MRQENYDILKAGPDAWNIHQALNPLMASEVTTGYISEVIVNKGEIIMYFSVTRHGKLLSKDLYNWDEETRTFTTKESDLHIDFFYFDNITFKTGSRCHFKTGSRCHFVTGSYCNFEAGRSCVFKTGSHCNFVTSSYCIFKTGSCCTFDTGTYCEFVTKSFCHFKTGNCCDFKTGSNCGIDTGHNCTFNTGPYSYLKTDSNCFLDSGPNSLLSRKDTGEIMMIPPNHKIKLNGFRKQGYEIIKVFYLKTLFLKLKQLIQRIL